jgi:hypothetical protein
MKERIEILRGIWDALFPRPALQPVRVRSSHNDRPRAR